MIHFGDSGTFLKNLKDLGFFCDKFTIIYIIDHVLINYCLCIITVKVNYFRLHGKCTSSSLQLC